MFKNLRRRVKDFLGNSLPISSIWGWAMPGEWGRQDLLKQYTRVMYAVISAIAEDSAKIEFIVYKKTDKEKTPLSTHPFLQLMEMPNPDMSQFQFLELHFTFMKLCGESYWYKGKGSLTKKTKELYLLRPDLMQVAINKDERGTVSGYVMNKPDGTKETFDKEEILHFKMPNPSNMYYGLGTIEAAKTYIETEQYASEWTKNALYNSGRPSGILNLKGTITDDEFQLLKKQFKNEYSGTKNAGKTLITKGADGLDYQKLGMDLGELALKDLKDMTRDDIMMMFRVSKTMLGISEGVNLNNARESRAMFKESIVLAEWDRLVDHLNAFLVPEFGVGIKIGYEHPDLQSGTDKVNEWTQGFNKWLTRNDIRKERNMKPIPGGDVVRESVGLIPILDDKKREPAPNPFTPGNNNNPNDGNNPNDPNNPNNDKKPPKDKPNPNDPNQDPNNPDNKPPKKSKKKGFLEQVEVYRDLLTDAEDRWQGIYQDAVEQEFNLQLSEILRKNKKQIFNNWLFDIEASNNRLQGNLVPIGIELMIEAARLALDIANDPNTDFMVDERVRDYIGERVARLSGLINDTTVKLLEASIAEGIQNGEALAKLRERVKEIYTEATDIRAERIARTESIAAGNQGALEAYRQSPLVNAKEWSTNPGACDFCIQFDGKIVGLDANFAHQGQTVTTPEGNTYQLDFEDIGQPPLHPNCRCVLLPVASDF